jgi:preprotein translocase subunit Sec63
MSNRAMYVALGLEPGAPSDEIKSAYRNLSMKFILTLPVTRIPLGALRKL